MKSTKAKDDCFDRGVFEAASSASIDPVVSLRESCYIELEYTGGSFTIGQKTMAKGDGIFMPRHVWDDLKEDEENYWVKNYRPKQANVAS